MRADRSERYNAVALLIVNIVDREGKRAAKAEGWMCHGKSECLQHSTDTTSRNETSNF